MSQPRDTRQNDLFRPSLAEIVNPAHPLVRLAEEIDWEFLGQRFGAIYRPGPGQPPLPVRLVAGLFILKHMHDLSDEALCARWIENPYYQYFCGEAAFRHELPFDRSSLSRWRHRLGDEALAALIQESLAVAHKTGALATKDLERVAVDTTVQPKAVAHPTEARLLHRALVHLVKLAKKMGVPLRQSYARLAKRAAIMVGRYIHAHQFKRANKMLRFLRNRLGRVIRDVRRKIGDDEALNERFRVPLGLAIRLLIQKHPSGGRRSMPCTPPRSSASARARPAPPTSSAARSASPPRSPGPRVVSSCCMPRPCTAIPSTATPWGRWWPIWLA